MVTKAKTKTKRTYTRKEPAPVVPDTVGFDAIALDEAPPLVDTAQAPSQVDDDMPDTFIKPSTMGVSVQAYPGYHTTLWNDPNDLQTMTSLGITPVLPGCKHIPQREMQRMTVSPRHGFCVIQGMIVGIEKDSHWQGRQEADTAAYLNTLRGAKLDAAEARFGTVKRMSRAMNADDE